MVKNSYWNDERFINNELFGGRVRFATFGAQPEAQPIFDGVTWFGNLTGHVNYREDVNIVTSGSHLTPLIAEGYQIIRLLAIEQYFRTNSNESIPYSIFPGGRFAGYNSNSYARSLLHHSGISRPVMEGSFPGWRNIIPSSYFGMFSSWRPDMV